MNDETKNNLYYKLNSALARFIKDDGGFDNDESYLKFYWQYNDIILPLMQMRDDYSIEDFNKQTSEEINATRIRYTKNILKDLKTYMEGKYGC